MRSIIEIATDEQEIERENRRAARASWQGESFRDPDPHGFGRHQKGGITIDWAKDGDIH